MARVTMVPGFELKMELAAAAETHEIASEVADDIRNNIRRDGLVHTRALVRSVRVRRRDHNTWRVGIGTDHWAHLEYGTGPRELIAGPGEVFRFVKENGEIVFTKRIRHPGNRAYRMVQRALFKKRVVTPHA